MHKLTYDIYDKKLTPYQKKINWNMAIGLNEVDGLKPSKYLIELAQKNISGELTNKAVGTALHQYYNKQNPPINYHERECDLVSLRIVDLLEDIGFVFSISTFKAVHQYLFRGLVENEGEFRTYNITRKESDISSDAVTYSSYTFIESTLENDFKIEKAKNYSQFDIQEIVKSIAEFTSSIWQVHPFIEGNTRTTAVFIQKYLKTIGFNVTNELFSDNSLYYRNALVLANYTNVDKKINPDIKFLESFYMKLMYDESIELEEMNKNLTVEMER